MGCCGVFFLFDFDGLRWLSADRRQVVVGLILGFGYYGSLLILGGCGFEVVVVVGCGW